VKDCIWQICPEKEQSDYNRSLYVNEFLRNQYLKVFMAQLGKKIEDEPSKPKLLINEAGIDYRFGC